MLKISKHIFALATTFALLALPLAAQPPQLTVHFSPDGGCTDAIVYELAKTRSTILVQAYSFTSPPIAKALVDAHKRGVRVTVILDKSQRSEKYSSADFLSHSGIPTFIDAKHAIAHNKIMILDGQTVFTGSFNFTKAAEQSNAENLIVIPDTAIAAQYSKNWAEHFKHSVIYTGKTAVSESPRKRK